jgi:putative transcriptional regulator
MRTELIERTRALLLQAGFHLSEPTVARPVSFDLVARKGDVLLLLKVFTNADSLAEPLAAELRTLAGLLHAAPLLVGERSSAGPLEDGVLYFRHKVPLTTPGTLEEYLLRGEPPLVYAAPGGYYVNVDGAHLRSLREARQLSLGQVAEAAGVSRRAVAMYEEGMGALVEVVERLEALFQEALVEPVPLFQSPAAPQTLPAFDPALLREALLMQVFQRLDAMGYKVVPTERSLFNAVGADQRREENLILTGVGDLDQELIARAKALQSIGAVVGREVVVIVRDRKRREHLEGTALIAQDELARMDEPGDVVDLIRRRARTEPADGA